MSAQLDELGQKLLQTLTRGTPDAPVSIVPPKILEQHIAILGKTGSGKTFAAKGFAETLMKQKRRVCVLDPTGVWWGLRSDSTGKKPAFPIFVFGGEHADLPLDPDSGAAIAEIIGTTDTPAVLDTRNLGVGERCRFFTAFAETLLQKNRGPLNLIIDESHLFIPQGKTPDPQSGRMLHAGNNLVSLGRGVGLRIMMITQRPAKLHKDSLTQAETLIALRLIAPQDRNAVEDWIGEWAEPKQGRELLSSLPSLPTGQGWIWAPELGLLEQLTFPRISTYDSSKAPDGASRNVVLAQIDLQSIERRLAAVEHEAPATNTPKQMRARIAELERQLKAPAVVEKPVLPDVDFERFANGVSELRELLARTVTDIERVVNGYQLGRNGVEPQFKRPIVSGLPVVDRSDREPPLPVRDRSPHIGISIRASGLPDSEIGKSGLRRMLIALAQNPAGLTDSKLGLRADVSVKGGSFDTYLSRGRKNGWIEGDRQELKITRAGLDALGEYEPLPKGRALLDHWLAKVGTGGTGRMLAVLARFYPKSLSAEELGNHAGVAVDGGSFDTYLSRLRGFDLITGKRSELRASEEFFK